jgi:hypothetical protein
MHVAMGIAYARASRKQDAERELDVGLSMQRMCLGDESAAVRTTQRVHDKIRGGTRIEELADDT